MSNYEITDQDGFIQYLETVIKDFNIKFLHNCFKIFTNSLEDYDRLKREFKNIEYYTFTLKNNKIKKLVLKAAPNMNVNSIQEKLIANNINVLSCVNLKSTKNRNSYSYLVSFPNETDLHTVKKIEFIGRIHFKWETYFKKDNISQCHRCQSFGHGSSNCNIKPKCVRCGECHLTKDCELDKNNPEVLKCANCEGNHTANYKNCPVYKKKIADKSSTNKYNQNSMQSLSQPVINRGNVSNNKLNLNSNMSYAAVTKLNSSNAEAANIAPNENFNDFQNLMFELKSLNNECNLKEMLNIVKNLKVKLQSCNSTFDKLVILSELAENLN